MSPSAEGTENPRSVDLQGWVLVSQYLFNTAFGRRLVNLLGTHLCIVTAVASPLAFYAVSTREERILKLKSNSACSGKSGGVVAVDFGKFGVE